MTDAFILDIPASRLSQVEQLVARFARKAPKLGCKAPVLTFEEWDRLWVLDAEGHRVAGPYDRALPHCFRDDVRVRTAAMATIHVVGERPILAGWSFVATLEHTEAGNLLRSLPGFEGDLPEGYRTTKPWCQHCAKRRPRKDTYVLREVATGRFIQVGRNCLADYLAKADPAAWLAFAEFARKLQAAGDFDEDGWGFASSGDYVHVMRFLPAVVRWLRSEPYVSGKQSYETGDTSTGHAVFTILTPSPHNERDRQVFYELIRSITEEDRTLAADAVAWVLSNGGTSDYMHNLRVAVQLPSVTSRQVNYLASLIPTFRKELGRRAARKEKLNEYLPGVAVGDRVDLPNLTVVAIICGQTEVQKCNIVVPTWRVLFQDADGRTLMWRAGTEPKFDVGDTLPNLRATIKEFNVYKDTLQTVITRGSVVAPKPVKESKSKRAGKGKGKGKGKGSDVEAAA